MAQVTAGNIRIQRSAICARFARRHQRAQRLHGLQAQVKVQAAESLPPVESFAVPVEGAVVVRGKGAGA